MSSTSYKKPASQYDLQNNTLCSNTNTIPKRTRPFTPDHKPNTTDVDSHSNTTCNIVSSHLLVVAPTDTLLLVVTNSWIGAESIDKTQ
jgi:hypothetical protein